MTAPVSILLHQLRCDGGTQTRAAMCQETVEAYTEALDALPPITVFRDDEGVHWLADGFHRVEAHRRAGRDMLRGYVTIRDREWTDSEGIAHVKPELRVTQKGLARAIELLIATEAA